MQGGIPLNAPDLPVYGGGTACPWLNDGAGLSDDLTAGQPQDTCYIQAIDETILKYHPPNRVLPAGNAAAEFSFDRGVLHIRRLTAPKGPYDGSEV